MILALLACRPPSVGPGAEVKLELRAGPAEPGQPLEVALLFLIPKGWHIYWENPGDTGIPTEATLAAGDLAVDGPRWTAPEPFRSGDLQNYGWEDHAAAFFTVLAPPPGPLELMASGSWLMCRESCIPGSGNARLSLELGERPGRDGLSALRTELPGAFPGDSGGAVSVEEGGAVVLRLPGPGPVWAVAAAPMELQSRETEEGGLLVRIPQPPAEARVLLGRGEGGARRAWEWTP